MTEAEKDLLYFRNHKGRYAPGGKWAGATRPMEGGTAAAGYIPKAAGTASRPQASAFRSHSGAVVSRAEPEALEADTMPYAPPRMAPDPFDKSIDKKADDVILETPVMELETQDSVYTPIATFIPGGSVR